MLNYSKMLCVKEHGIPCALEKVIVADVSGHVQLQISYKYWILHLR